MLKQLTILSIVLLTMAFTIFPAEQNKVYHDNNAQLKWSDFQGKPDSEISGNALSSVGFQMSYKGTARQDSLIFIVEAFFDRETSWFKGDTNTYALSHEQTHFDITELYARKLKQSLQGATLTYKNYQTVIRDLERNNHKAMNTVDSIYDVTTDYSRIKAEQLKWNTNIKQDLENLKAFSIDTFTVPVHL